MFLEFDKNTVISSSSCLVRVRNPHTDAALAGVSSLKPASVGIGVDVDI